MNRVDIIKNLNPQINPRLIENMFNKNIFRVYKVQRLSDKKFSTVSGWSDVGKVFHRKSHAKLHVNAHRFKFNDNPSVIVTYTLEELEREVV